MSLTLKMLIVIIGAILFFLYWIKQDINRLYRIGNFLKDFFIPNDLTATPDAFTKMQLKALLDKRTISRLLFYRSYIEDEESRLGFFKMHDGRLGIIFKVEPPVYLTEKTENVILNILSAIVNDDTVVHISALAGRDISEYIDRMKRKSDYSKVNLKHPEHLKELNKSHIESLQKWTEESLMGKDADFRVRNFTHMVSILFPLDLDKERIIKQSNEIFGILKESFNGVIADDKDIVSFVKEILNPAQKFYPKEEDPVSTISKRMSRGAEIKVDKDDGILYLKDGWMAQTLTTEKYPKSVDAFGFQNIFFDSLGNDRQIHIPCPFYLSLVVKFSDVEKMRKKVTRTAKWNIGQLAPLTGSVIEKRNPTLKERRKESESVLHYIEYLGEKPLDAYLSLTIYENDKTRLQQTVASIKSSFADYPGRWVIKEERYSNIAFYITIMGLPLNYSEAIHSVLDKFDKNFKSNNAQIAPLIGGFKGLGENGIFTFIDRTGQAFTIDLLASKENYNAVLVGPMGTGKSFYVNEMLCQALDAGWQVRMIDFGRSYLKLSEAIGGEFLEFTKESNICLNFFTNLQTTIQVIDEVETSVIDTDEFESIVPIVGLMMGISLKEIYKSSDSSSSEKLELSVISTFVVLATNEVFKRHGHDGGMRELGEILDEMRRVKLEENNNIVNDESELLAKMVTSLQPYSDPKGQFFKYFNGPNNINLESSMFTLELDDISSSPMMPVVAMSFLQRAAQEAFIEYLKDMSTTRIIGVDEAHKVLGNEIFARFFDDFGRRIRKYRGVPILITQSIQDFDVNPSARAFLQLASWKIFLKQKQESIQAAIKSGILVLNSHQKAMMSSAKLKTPWYNEFFLMHADFYFVGILKVNAYKYWTYTTNPKDRSKLEDLSKDYNITTQDAIWLSAKLEEGLNIESALYQLTKAKSNSGDKDWDKLFKYVLENNQVHIAKQDVVYKKENEETIEYQEFLMKIMDENGILYNAGVFMDIANEKHYFLDLSKRFLDKIFVYISKQKNSNINFSINISYNDIINKDYVEYFFGTLKQLGSRKKHLFVEIELDYTAKENFKALMNFAKRVRDADINIAFDNILMKHLDFESFVRLEPKYLKLSASTLDEILENETTFSKSLLKALTETTGMKLIATKVENEEDIENAQELGINRFQGYFINKTSLLEG